jgi:hypothetical protein
MDLVEFLRARLDDDKRIAEAASEPGGPHWPNSDIEIRTPQMEHARRHDPARVLAEVEAKRRIVEAFEADDNRERYGGCGDDCEWKALDYALRLLALPYADHPDYRPEWKP